MNSNNWIFKALILGTVFFIAALVIKPVGVSTQFSVLSGIIHNTIDPDVIVEDESRDSGYASKNAYYDRNDGKIAESIEKPWNYDFVFVLAIPLGAFIGYFLTGDRRSSKADDKHIPIRKYIPAFLGGFILLYGARMADGCTSGHMMSGIMQGSVSGYIFAAAVFATAIPTAIIVGRRRMGERS